MEIYSPFLVSHLAHTDIELLSISFLLINHANVEALASLCRWPLMGGNVIVFCGMPFMMTLYFTTIPIKLLEWRHCFIFLLHSACAVVKRLNELIWRERKSFRWWTLTLSLRKERTNVQTWHFEYNWNSESQTACHCRFSKQSCTKSQFLAIIHKYQ